MVDKTKICLFFAIFLGLMLIPCVYADNDEAVSLTDLPAKLSEFLTIPLFPAKLLTSSIILALFVIPTTFACSKFNKDVVIPDLLVGFLALSFCISMGWLPVWIFVIIVLIVAVFFARKLTETV